MAVGAVATGLGGPTYAAGATGSRSVPPVTDLDKFYDAWQERLNSGDLEGLVDLYVEDVTYVNPDGKLLYGKSAVRVDFEGLVALKPNIVLGNRRHVVYHDVALTTNHWRMNFTNADGVKQELTGGGIEVLRKQADGGWRYIIDDASRSAF
ncbi:MAG: SgcJ/EcaC family oxidoreductase [Sphingosinicella sp.]|nr:SgcJ/EcaC family oxidoreductase [Sphingosinicella sp.]